MFLTYLNISSPIQEVDLASMSCVLYRKSEVVLKVKAGSIMIDMYFVCIGGGGGWEEELRHQFLSY